MVFSDISKHRRILSALFLRELTTRYGREGLGFAWLVAEPLTFCFGVLIMWGLTKPPYEHGVRLAPFVMTGYISIIVYRHMVGYSMGALQANVGLLHHRQVTPVHVFLTRNLLEYGGVTVSFLVVYTTLLFLRQVDLPHNLLLLYEGWLLLGWVSMGFALSVAGLAMRFPPIERVVPITTYALIPLSSAFFMVDWIPEKYRAAFLTLPFAHPVEMIRGGVFGEFVKVHYDAPYALVVATALNIFGLLMIASSRDNIDVE